MMIKLLVDVCLPPAWEDFLTGYGWPTIHWSRIGDPSAKDTEIMVWALANDRVVFTQDLDFGTLLALTHAIGPSVLQVRGEEVLPRLVGHSVLMTLKAHALDLKSGALVTLDTNRSRIRLLPF
jgi:predicted nuclease of predicted toxin-antitoxin system